MQNLKQLWHISRQLWEVHCGVVPELYIVGHYS